MQERAASPLKSVMKVKMTLYLRRLNNPVRHLENLLVFFQELPQIR